ncbi:MAG: hypothetical protein IKT41_02310 [Clostridia bacterium]|nr:hypothetical protein [Clostridia bacterium]
MKKFFYILAISLFLVSSSVIPSFSAESTLVLEKISGDLSFDIVGDYNANGKNQIIALVEDEDGEGGTFYTLEKNGEITTTKKYETMDEIFESEEYTAMFFPSSEINEYPIFKLVEDTNSSNTGKFAVFKYTSSEDTDGTRITDYKYFNPHGSFDSYIYSNNEYEKQVLGLVVDGTQKLVEYIDENGNVLIPASSGFVANSNNMAETFNYEYSSIVVRDANR